LIHKLKLLLKKIDNNDEEELEIFSNSYPVFNNSKNFYIRNNKKENMMIRESQVMYASLLGWHFKLSSSNFSRKFKKHLLLNKSNQQ
jgi:hypothetical protein